jgi:RNA polymerase sigma-70 factor (ECF subfamily)
VQDTAIRRAAFKNGGRAPAPYFLEHRAGRLGHSIEVNRLLNVVPPADAPASEQDDQRLVAGLRAGEAWAAGALVQRYGSLVRRVLFRVLGTAETEVADLSQEVFARAWRGIDGLSDTGALKAWLTRIAVFTARGTIRHRRRRRWLSFLDRVPEPDPIWAGPDLQEAARCVYHILDRMPVDERVPYTLHVLGGLDLQQTADACGTSLSTARRRIVKAERRFFALAREFDALAPWLREEP